MDFSSTINECIGKLAMEAIDEIASREYGEETRIRTAALVLEVDTPESSDFLVISSDDRPWFQIAYLNEATLSLERRLEMLEALSAMDDEDED